AIIVHLRIGIAVLEEVIGADGEAVVERVLAIGSAVGIAVARALGRLVDQRQHAGRSDLGEVGIPLVMRNVDAGAIRHDQPPSFTGTSSGRGRGNGISLSLRWPLN